MRHVYLLMYDIADPKRLRKVYRSCLGVGDPVQFSVFRCELSKTELLLLRERLWTIIHHTDDRVMVVELGPAPRDNAPDTVAARFTCWGAPPLTTPQRGAVVV